MPISEEEFRRGRTADSLSQKIWEFLVGNPGQAFTADEVAVGIGQVEEARPGVFDLGRGLTVLGISITLNEWVKRGIAESAQVEDQSGFRTFYYRAKPRAPDGSQVRWN